MKYNKFIISLAIVICAALTGRAQETFNTSFFTGETYTWRVNPDGKTVNLTTIEPGRHATYDKLYIRREITNKANGKVYDAIGIGSGTGPLHFWKSESTIPAHILRLEDYCLYYDGFGTSVTFTEDSNVEYIGKNALNDIRVENMYINRKCELRSTGATVENLHFGKEMPVGDVNGSAFQSIDTIRCSSSEPLDIKFPLLPDEKSYKRTVLIVPDGSKSCYQAHEEWSKFTDIRTESEHVQITADFDKHYFYVFLKDGKPEALFKRNDENHTATLITSYVYKTSCPDSVQDIKTGRKYLLNEIGDGVNPITRSESVRIVIGKNITRVNDNAMISNIVLPRGNRLTYVGKNAIKIDGTVEGETLHIPDGCVFRSQLPKTLPLYIKIGENVTLGDSESGAAVFSAANEAKCYIAIRSESTTPPRLNSPLFPQGMNTEDMRMFIYAPEESVATYAADPAWSQVNEIHAFRGRDFDKIDLSGYEPTGKQFRVTHKFQNQDQTQYQFNRTYRVNADGITATMINHWVPYDIPDLHLDEEAVDPETGIHYKVVAIGDGVNPLEKDFDPKVTITPNIEVIRYCALQHNLPGLNYDFSQAKNLKLIEFYTIPEKKNLVKGLVIPDDCQFQSPGVMPDSVTIGNIEMLGYSSDVFDFGGRSLSQNNTPTPKVVITCNSLMPPIVIGNLFPLEGYYDRATLIVKDSCIDFYRNSPEWSRIATIISVSDTYDHPGSATVPVTGTLPVVYINTADRIPITQKETYIDATMWIDAKGIEGFESVGSEEKPLALGIRGRGNASWTYDKKPYKIKLDKKTSILGMPKQKHFALLNHWSSMEGIVEMLGFEIGKRVGLAWTPAEKPVEVVLNGRNIGLYFLTESIKIDPNRVDIYEQEDQNTDPSLVDGGWLLEIDNYDDPCQVKIIQDPNGSPFEGRFTYKSPEDLSELQHDWLVSELTSITNMIYCEDKTDTSWTEKIDAEELARYYIAQELVGNLDAFFGSTYLYKDLGGKWMFGPLWDTGWSMDQYPRTETFAEMRHKDCPHCNFIWIEELWKFPDFRNVVYDVWKNVYPAKLNGINDFITNTAETLREAYVLNYTTIWPQEYYYDVNEIAPVNIIKLEDNIKWMNNFLSASALIDITADGKALPIRLTNNHDGSFSIVGAEVTRISITDINGRAVNAQLTEPNTFTTNAPAGVYILSAETATGRCLPVKMVVR